MALLLIQEQLDKHMKPDTELSHRAYEKINKVESFFTELDDIYENRERHSLHWAFDNASTKINAQLDRIDTHQIQYDINDQTVTDLKYGFTKASNKYNLLSRITLILDVVISVFLILGVTLISQQIEQTLESFFVVTFFIGLMALMKVSLDRFYIIPKIDAWGWEKYHNLTHRVFDWITERIIQQYTSIPLSGPENLS